MYTSKTTYFSIAGEDFRMEKPNHPGSPCWYLYHYLSVSGRHVELLASGQSKKELRAIAKAKATKAWQ